MFDTDDTLVRASDGRLMMPIIRLARWAKRLGYVVVIMTARRATRETIRYTEEQLDEIDVPYDRLLFVPAAEKSIAKQRLGYTFVLSVGDQWTDLGSSRHFLNTQTTFPMIRTDGTSEYRHRLVRGARLQLVICRFHALASATLKNPS